MTAEGLLSYLEGLGFALWIDGEEISGEGPTELLTPELLESIRLHKAELLVLLAEASKPKPQIEVSTCVDTSRSRRQGPELWPLSNELSVLGPEGFDLAGEDKDLARLYQRSDGQPRISKY